MADDHSNTLAGVHVVSIATNLPGPLAARHLLRLGASVTKIEPPSGDPVRAFPKWYEALNDGQTVKTLDLKSTPDQEHFFELLQASDLLISSMRPEAAERLGLYDMVVRALIAHVEIVGDTESPNEAGHDLTYQAAAGLLNPPEMPRVPWADVIGGYKATIAALDALREREHAQKVGENRAVHRRIGLKQGVDEAAEAFFIGATAPGQVLSGSQPEYGVYRTQDGWIAVAAIEPHFRSVLHELLGQGRSSLEHQFAQRSTAHWLQFARDHDLPVSAIDDTSDGRRV